MVREEYRNQGVGAAQMAAILAGARRAVDFYLCNGVSHHRQVLLWEPGAP